MKLLVRKTKRLATVFTILFAAMLLTMATQAQEKFILSISEFTVKNGHEKQFEDGIKEWKECYLENGGEWTWQMWKRNNGKGSVYVLSSRIKNWAEFDDAGDEAGKTCRDIAMEKIVAHVESRETNYYHSMPDISKGPTMEMGVIWVTFFEVENGTVFNNIIKEVSGIIKEAEGDERGYWYDAAGGSSESPDYFVTTPFKNYAALDIERDGVWKMVENAKGAEATEKMRDEFRGSVKDMYSYIYKRMDDLSHFTAPEAE